MKRFFSIWCIPGVLFGIMIGVWNTTYTSKFNSVAPIERVEEHRTIEEIIVDKSIELKLSPKSDVLVNGIIGGVIGWIITKLLDSLARVIRRRRLIRNDPENKSKISN